MEFPDFLFGTFDEVKTRSAKQGVKWAKTHGRSSRFSSPSLRAVEQGEIVVTSDLTDLDRLTARWRLYGVDLFHDAIGKFFSWKNCQSALLDFESYLLETPWGALSSCISHRFPNSIAREAARVAALVSFWAPLSQLRYVGRRSASVIMLDDIVTHSYDGLLETWGGDAGATMPDRLQRAVSAMSSASPRTVRKVLLERMVAVATADPRLSAHPPLTNRNDLAIKLDGADELTISDLESGHTPSLRRTLYTWLPR